MDLTMPDNVLERFVTGDGNIDGRGRDETCHLGIERGPGQPVSRLSQLEEMGPSRAVPQEVWKHIAPSSSDEIGPMAWRGREQKTDAGNRQIRDFQLTESVDNGFSKELVKLRENRGKGLIHGGERRVVKKDQNVRAPHGVVYDNDSTMTRRGRVSNDGEVRKLLEPRKLLLQETNEWDLRQASMSVVTLGEYWFVQVLHTVGLKRRPGPKAIKVIAGDPEAETKHVVIRRKVTEGKSDEREKSVAILGSEVACRACPGLNAGLCFPLAVLDPHSLARSCRTEPFRNVGIKSWKLSLVGVRGCGSVTAKRSDDSAVARTPSETLERYTATVQNNVIGSKYELVIVAYLGLTHGEGDIKHKGRDSHASSTGS
ncbi:hypothetical protein EDB89DRAFT_2132905 [Lactarius sanguifluus]|nr:hypothetical protein EDB89DRAFT_2132905 [Lactarius sanguifluus]